MEMKLRFNDLPCYQSEDIKAGSLADKSRNLCFSIDKLPTEGLQQEFYSFVMHRGIVMKATSLRADLTQYNVVCRFLSEKHPKMESLIELPLDTLVKDMKKWLLMNGKPLTTRKVCKRVSKDEQDESIHIRYLKKVYRFLMPEDERPEREKDIWKLDRMGLILTDNPIKNTETLNFTKIVQDEMRQEVKDAAFMELQTRAVGTVQAELVAINRFSSYLAENFSDVKSMADVNREIVESYLIYLNTEATDRKSYRSDIFHLKAIIDLVGRMTDNPGICNLFLITDIPKNPEKLYKSYSDAELKRLNSAIVTADVQVARALILHQMLGTRISDTLTLKQDCVFEKDGKLMIRIDQIKSRRTYRKTINEEMQELINAAIKYTKAHSPDSPYIFANDKDASRPMTYSKIQYQLMAIINENDLRDDNGEQFGVGTHLFRHTYGRKLTEMHVDDTTIAKLLGHSNNSSVKYYRKMSNTQLADETREMRQSMDEILQNLIKGW